MKKINNPYAKKYKLNEQQVVNLQKEIINKTLIVVAYILKTEKGFNKEVISEIMELTQKTMQELSEEKIQLSDIIKQIHDIKSDDKA